MTQKMTRKKRESESRGWKERNDYNKMIYDLKGDEKKEYEINMLKARIKNCEDDLKNFGESVVLINKINNMKNKIKELEDGK